MERLTKRRIRGNGYVSAIGSGCGCWGKIIDRLAAYEDTGLEPGEITIGRPACVFYYNRQCNLNGDFCAEGPGCPFELDGARAWQFLLQTTQPNDPLTLDELREMTEKKPVVVWVVCLDEDGIADHASGEWEMFSDNTFIGDGIWDNIENYGKIFVAYCSKPEARPQEGD